MCPPVILALNGNSLPSGLLARLSDRDLMCFCITAILTGSGAVPNFKLRFPFGIMNKMGRMVLVYAIKLHQS